MINLHGIPVALVGVLAFSLAGPSFAASSDEGREATALQGAKVTLLQAISTAEQQTGGKAFDAGEILVSLDRVRGAEILGRHAGADDIDAVELGLRRDLIDLAGPREVVVTDVEREVLGHLLRIHDFANCQADLDGRAQG